MRKIMLALIVALLLVLAIAVPAFAIFPIPPDGPFGCVDAVVVADGTHDLRNEAPDNDCGEVTTKAPTP